MSRLIYPLAIALAAFALIVLWCNGPVCEEDASECAIKSETRS